jgi:CelD/BcsL family acetyltransferase involved in cellulose biosynthesis
MAVSDPRALAGYVPAWKDLAAKAIEPNPFLEHWALLPALHAFGTGKQVTVILVLNHETPRPDAYARLGLLLPLEQAGTFRQLKVLRSWQYPQCGLGTPLVRAATARESVAELCSWLGSREPAASMMELGNLVYGGPLHELLAAVAGEAGLRPRSTDRRLRSLWCAPENAPADAAEALPIGLRRRLHHRELRLRERGHLRPRVLGPGDDLERWIGEFQSLAQAPESGASAVLASDAGRGFFAATAAAARERGRLVMLGLDFNHAPIARRCLLTSGDGAIVLETVVDARLAAESPLDLLELHCMRELYALGLHWMDSGAQDDRQPRNRLLGARKTIETLILGDGS